MTSGLFPSRARAARGMLWPLVVVLGLMLFTTVDGDGDPTTANGPAVVLTKRTAGADAPEREPHESAGVVGQDDGARPRRSAGRWVEVVRAAWFGRLRPIRGP